MKTNLFRKKQPLHDLSETQVQSNPENTQDNLQKIKAMQGESFLKADFAKEQTTDVQESSTAELQENQMSAVQENQTANLGVIGEKEIDEAYTIFKKYKAGKIHLERRIIDNEKWWKMRQWNAKKDEERIPAYSAWLFNAIAAKHADAMDNYPEPAVLPRESSDKDDAQTLSSVLPVILEQNQFEQTYNDFWWYKLKFGTGVLGVFWDPAAANGLGDVSIKKMDMLNLFWQPGIMDIQNSRNFFVCELIDNEVLEEKYPQLKHKLSSAKGDVASYIYDDTVDTSDKSELMHWYYKKQHGTKQVLHYCQFCAGEVLFATENEPQFSELGFYNHGKYPFVFDPLFVEEGTPVGFSYIDVCKSPQEYIDKLNDVILKNAIAGSRRRFFVRGDGGINEDEFKNWDNEIIHVNGSVGEEDIREFKPYELSGVYVSVLNNKVEELKETSGNRDYSQGGTTSGVTAASAIAALQEAGSKLSRDTIKSSYRAFVQVNYLVLELIRQFYDIPRSFRITGDNGKNQFIDYSNKNIKMQQYEKLGNNYCRVPVFDIKITSQKSSAFSKISQNELAKEMYQLGFFNPSNAQQSLNCIDMMDFEGKQMIVDKISQGETLQNQLMGMTQQALKLAACVDSLKGTNISAAMAQQLGISEQQLQKMTGNVNTRTKSVNTNSLGSEVATHSNAETAKDFVDDVASPR